jgi:hypothetical protein
MNSLQSFTLSLDENLLIRNALMSYKAQTPDHKEINSVIVKLDDLKTKGKYHFYYQ